jgi:ABC-2 type transport system ATP-binding protein
LILNIGKTKTVLLSTHIMQEVEAICDRVVIIKDGKIVADDTTVNIQQNEGEQQTVFVEFDKEYSRNQLRQINGVSSVKHLEGNQWLFASSEDDVRASIAKFAQQHGLLVLTMRVEEKSMEEVFKALTKK